MKRTFVPSRAHCSSYILQNFNKWGNLGSGDKSSRLTVRGLPVQPFSIYHFIKPHMYVSHSPLWGASPPALVPQGEAPQTLPFGWAFLHLALGVPPGQGRGLLLQLGQVLHAAVDLQAQKTNVNGVWGLNPRLDVAAVTSSRSSSSERFHLPCA